LHEGASIVRVLILGGTGFIGKYIVTQLHHLGHDVVIFHRGQTTADLPQAVTHIIGERQHLADHTDTFRQIAPDVVLDTIAYTEQQAQSAMQLFTGVTPRLVALSSIDVYWAYGRHHRIEDGPIDPRPLTEESPLRQRLYTARGATPRLSDDPWRWLDDMEKIRVERTVMNCPEIAGTILRLPMVYGPGTWRLFAYLKRMDDHRPAILLDERAAKWRGARGYVENVATAIALAVVKDGARQRVYNIAEPEALAEAEWVRQIGQLADWHGEIVRVPAGRLPTQADPDQHWIIDSTRIRQELGYTEPITHSEALQRTISWERANPPEQIDSSWFGLDYASEDSILAELNCQPN
jgi:nucleoside-diphosphate-sugar epimerase